MSAEETDTTIERRYTVTGRKNGEDFVDGSNVNGDPVGYIERYQQRIDNPPVETWQPTIVEAVVYERSVGPWVEIARTRPRQAATPDHPVSPPRREVAEQFVIHGVDYEENPNTWVFAIDEEEKAREQLKDLHDALDGTPYAYRSLTLVKQTRVANVTEQTLS